MGFWKSWCEMVAELGRGCRDISQQTAVTEDSFILQKLGGPVAKVSGRLRFLNEFLPKDRDPVHAWPVIFFVFILALTAPNLNGGNDSLVLPVKKVLSQDVLITLFTCGRTGSGDAVVAAIMRKLTSYPEMFENQDILERQLRFCSCSRNYISVDNWRSQRLPN